MANSPAYPLINGNRFDGSSVTVRINGKKYVGVQEIDYEAMVEPGFVYGVSTAVPIGRTRGQLKTDNASITILREDYADILSDFQALAVGFSEANFQIIVSYSEAPNLAAGTPQSRHAGRVPVQGLRPELQAGPRGDRGQAAVHLHERPGERGAAALGDDHPERDDVVWRVKPWP
jgi:hypothetical protein